MRILHLSDLHFGVLRDPASGIESSVHRFVRGADPDPEAVLSVLKKDLSFVERPPDFVVISGDLGWAGTDADYLHGERFLVGLRDWVGDCIVLAPGNHDVNISAGVPDDHRQDAFLALINRFYG